MVRKKPTTDPITDRRYPKCTRAGVLRMLSKKRVVVSTSALYAMLGSKRYTMAVEQLDWSGPKWVPGPTPESTEMVL